ncbi:MFS transporter, sugar porter family protein [Mycobacterium kansasii]|uniref:MFS transporter, sugar porter family protein n=1 Tax=Mycobacterium kansasii TaxID=1768 RepID=A0A1V3WTX0_MYCKA|nr:MFS transporter, sugar porter family protein [Mycobacterium kansasii]
MATAVSGLATRPDASRPATRSGPPAAADAPLPAAGRSRTYRLVRRVGLASFPHRWIRGDPLRILDRGQQRRHRANPAAILTVRTSGRNSCQQLDRRRSSWVPFRRRRRRTQRPPARSWVAGVVAAFGSVIAATAHGTPMIVIGRLILGVAVGVTTAVTPSYIGELANVDKRGPMMAAYQFSIASGFLLAFTVGALLSFGGHEWRIMFLANAIPAILQTATMTRVPSSPYSLVARGRPHQARNTLTAIRHRDEVTAELQSIIAAHRERGRPVSVISDPSLWRPIMVAMGASLMDVLVGICAVVYYSTAVFAMAGVGGHAGAEIASFSVGLIDVVFTVIAVSLLNRHGRRPLLTVGLTGMILALTATSFGLLSPSAVSGAITIAAMLAFTACHAFSAGPIGWLLVAEVLPTRIRSRGSAVAIALNWVANLVVALLFPILVGSPGQPSRAAIGFLIFAGISLGFLVFVRVCVPETKGLTLAEVEAKLTGRNIDVRQDDPTD